MMPQPRTIFKVTHSMLEKSVNDVTGLLLRRVFWDSVLKITFLHYCFQFSSKFMITARYLNIGPLLKIVVVVPHAENYCLVYPLTLFRHL